MSDNQLNTNQYLSDCDSKDVIAFKNEKWTSVRKLKRIINEAILNYGINSITNRIIEKSNFKDKNSIYLWFNAGEECEILRAGSPGWQKGKIKIKFTLEFIPDEPEENKSPLDDVRQQIDSGD